ncbi:stealth conserved region 3 domain-containing protein [Nocardioides sp.]|uniref:stealth conserved region 3 domain-containing protein n=1 Tax=Nocardioides sp. TaxID=35761 RepID=UPI001A18EFFE|nr:stealth conserved region 3 domain-containing protein [Nocardioides sp.]MBJ7357971.1 stealth conserved region 3 domain-containing protein [Nocardioides sp.]
MRIAYLVLSAYAVGGTERAAITQANALARDHDVTVISVLRAADEPHYAVDDRVTLQALVDARPDVERDPLLDSLLDRESVLVPRRWDGQFSAATDVALETALSQVRADVVVTVTPALLACAVQLLPDGVVVVHQEHRSSSQRTSGMEPLLAYAPRADVVALLTPSIETWLRDELGPVAPETVVVPNALPQGSAPGQAPRSLLDGNLIVTAGRLVMEKQFTKLVAAFGEVADQIPDWRLRILGVGHQRPHLVRETRKRGLFDRVELPGTVSDMRGEWAKASICALSSRAEGFPLVLQEAMAAGVPCVSFDCASGPREIVEHEVNGLLVTPESVAGLSAAILRLATDDELRTRLGAGALASSVQYDADTIAARWVEVFEAAVARRAGRPRFAALSTVPPRPGTAAPAVEDARQTPAHVRHLTLAAAVSCARATGDEWLVIPPHERESAVVVVPTEARHRFLGALADAGLPAYVSLRDPANAGWHERRGVVSELARDLQRGRTPVVVLEPWPLGPDGLPSVVGQGCSVEVEFWETSTDGQLVAPRLNPYTQRIPRGFETVETEVEGVTVRTLPLMTEPTVDECTFPVDVVYTWVDGNDPVWNAAREQRLARLTGTGSAETAQTRESSGQARFVSRDELRYSLRSVHLFAPWVRRIHLVTAGQVPDWLDLDHSSVTVVDHSAILPADALPTFNSHAIETSLHRVPDLAEHFVYFNDDFFLGRPIRPEAWFSPAGLPATFVAPTTVGLSDLPDAPPYLKAAWNNRRLLLGAFGRALTHNLAHAPYPHRRSVLEELTERFPEALAATARSPFRSDGDVSTLSSLAQHYGLMTGQSFVGESSRAYVNLSNSDLDWQLKKTLQRDQDFICLADHHDHALNPVRLNRTLKAFMEAYFPVPAPWEKPGPSQ